MPKGICHKYTEEQLAFIKKNKTLPRKELGALFNQAFGTDVSYQALSSIRKKRGWLTGRTGHFPKNGKPWNTGTKGVMKPNKTSFKKGCVAPNAKPLGYERLDSKDGYRLVKIEETNPYTGAKTRFKSLQIVNWEKANGPVPKGYVVRLKDGDKNNCDPSNLELVTNDVNLRLNRYQYSATPLVLKPTIMLCAKLESAVFTIENKD